MYHRGLAPMIAKTPATGEGFSVFIRVNPWLEAITGAWPQR